MSKSEIFSKKFWAQVTRSDQCWNWTGYKTPKGGHGVCRNEEGKTSPAHRVAYELLKGSVPAGLVLSHSCDNPSCCRPDHLRAVDQKENMREMIARGRGGFQKKFGVKSTEVRRQGKPTPKRIGIPLALLTKKPRGAIVNLCGSPGSGKTHLLSLITKIGNSVILEIDDYRKRLFDNSLSWAALVNDVANFDGMAIVVSSGLSVSLTDLRLLADQQGRGFRTIIIETPIGECLTRVSTRPRRFLPGVDFSIEQIIAKCDSDLLMKWPRSAHIQNPDGSAEEAARALAGHLERISKNVTAT